MKNHITNYETSQRERDLYMQKDMVEVPRGSTVVILLIVTAPIILALMGLGVVKLIEWIF